MGRDRAYIYKWLIIMYVPILLSCQSQRLAGRYILWKNSGPDYFEITILDNNTFYHSAHSDILGDQKLNGTWKLIDDTLLLSPDNVQSNIQMIEQSDILSHQTILQIYQKDLPVMGATVILNSKDTLITNERGEISTYLSVDSIRIIYFNAVATLKSKNKNAKRYLINWDIPTLDIISIPEKFRVTNRKIIPYGSDGSLQQDMIYRKRD